MFNFLKEKLKGAISKFSKKVEEEIKEERLEESKEEKVEEKKSIKERIKEKFKKPKEKEEIREEKKEETKVEEEKPKSFFDRFRITKKISEERFDELFWELEVALMENNVAVEIIDKIKEEMKVDLVDVPIKGKVEDVISNSLKNTLNDILDFKKIDLINEIKKKKPYVILLFGYNGAGKSITAAKLAKYFLDKNLKPLLGAGDTFRAAGATQLDEYGEMIKVNVIRQEKGSDSCALIFDTIQAAKSKKYDVVIADTAGRLHINKDLLRELEKIVRVNKPNLKLLVIDALSGGDVVEQAKEFDKAIGIDGFIITKVDSYEKGGAVLNASYVTGKPILFFGVGQKLSDLKEFNKEEVLRNLGF